MARSLCRSECGFTLLEILVAFTLLALVFTVLLRVFSTGIRGVAATDGYNLATAHAKALLLKTGSERELIEGVDEGEQSGGFSWRREVKPFDPPRAEGEAAVGGLYHVAVAVSWQSPLGPREVRLDTLKLIPGEARR